MKLPLVCLVIVGGATLAVASEYSLVDLGVLPGYVGTAVQSVSENGIATGYCWSDAGEVQGFVWQNGVMTGLGYPSGCTYSFGYGVNSSGQVAGEGSDPKSKAFSWSGGTIAPLASPGDGEAWTRGINEAGQIAGGAVNGSNEQRAVVWTGGVATEFSPLAGHVLSSAYAINNSGDICGYSYGPSKPARATAWIGGTAINLGSGFVESLALSISDNGLVAGWGNNLGYGQAVLWQNGTHIDLGVSVGSAESAALSVNNAGDVVGYYNFVGGRWRNGGYETFDSLVDGSGAGWSFGAGAAITNSGLIGVNGGLGDFARAAILVPVPEPATMAALGLGLLALQRRRKA